MSPTRLACLLACLTFLPLPTLPITAETRLERVQSLYQQAVEAYGKKDFPAYYAKISSVAELLPDDPGVVFRLAGASALTGRSADAERLLKRLATMQVYRDLAGSPDFAAIREGETFRTAAAAMEALKSQVGIETVAFRLPERDFVPEAVAWDPATKSFLVSSVHLRKVVRVGRGGAVKELVPEGRDGLWSALGIAVDAKRRVLWVCSTAHPQTRGARPEDLGKAALFAFHADSGKLLGRYPLDGGATGHSCDSVAVSSRGDAYVSDGNTGAVYWLRQGGKALETFLAAGTLISAQSLAFAPREKVLFIADYAQGVFRVDLASRKAVLLPGPADASFAGIDGLAFHKGSLVAVQNGIEPNRVARLRLSPGLDRIEGLEVLARNLPVFDGPGLGTMVDGTFYYVGNSHWGRFDEKGNLPDAATLSEPAVLKIPLE
jgi:sugar lactone lactonase YvrE